MSGRLRHIPGVDGNDTRRYFPRRNPSFAGYEQIPRIPPPPKYELPTPVHSRYIATQGRLWEAWSPNSLQNAFCPGTRPSNLNLGVTYLAEQDRRYDGHMGPFDPTRNAQLSFPGREWRPFVITPAAGQPRDSPEYEVITNCWKSDARPAFDTGSVHNYYIDKLISKNQEVEKRLEALYKVYSDRYSMEPLHRALWSSTARPVFPSSEYLDTLRRIKRFPLAVDWIADVQRGIKDKHAFVDYVSRLQNSPSWTPDPLAPVEMADDRYLGIWLNGTEERLARWYLKEGVPCFVLREVLPPERDHLAAQDTLVDFAAGSTASVIHWSTNEYDSMALTRGDMSLSGTTIFHNPGWVWSTLLNNLNTPTEKPEAKPKEVSYDPPPLDVVTIAQDRVPWIRPPPVKKATPSRPGAPPHERKRWIKYMENYDPNGTFREVGTKQIIQHRVHSMYDRERRWHIHFLRPPKAPEGCVSNPDVFGQPCPAGIYLSIGGTRRPQPQWIYKTMEPKSMDIGRTAPTPKPEDLPLLKRSLPSAPDGNDDDDDSDDDYYPEYPGYVQPDKNSTEITNESSAEATVTPAASVSSAITIPAASDSSAITTPVTPLSGVEPAALGATTGTEAAVDVIMSSSLTPSIPATNRIRSEDEVSLGDEESIPETMGPQIVNPAMNTDEDTIPEAMGPQIPLPTEDTDMGTNLTNEDDPLEFASSHLMLYGVPNSEEFATIQNLTSTIAARLDLTIRRIFRVSDSRNQSFWFEMESIDHARRMRTYMHHRQENGLEPLVSYANYDDYVKALTRSTHQWPDSATTNVDQSLPTPSLRPPAAGTSARRQVSRDRHQLRETRRRSPSSERYRASRRSPPPFRRHSPTRSTYSRRRYQRSRSPRYRERTPYRRSQSPILLPSYSSRETTRDQTSSSEQNTLRPPILPATTTPLSTTIPPLPTIPSLPASLGIPHNTPLPFGANIAFMWSPSGNTLSPVLLQGNTTVIPFPLSTTGPTPSALLPWPVAASLPASAVPMTTGATNDPFHAPLSSRITVVAEPQPESPPPTESSHTLLSRITSQLSDRLSDPVPQLTLATRLSDPQRASLSDRLETDDQMEVDYGQVAESSESLNRLRNIRAPSFDADDHNLHPRTGDYTPPRDFTDKGTDDEDEEGEVTWKKTKRGRRSGNKIQGYRTRDKERKVRKRRRQRRR